MKKKVIFLSLISLLLFITSNVKALDYEIDSYDVDIVVNKNNTFDITETIDAYFNTYKHGIIRKIPLKNQLRRLDGTFTNNKVKIENVSVDNEFTEYKEGNYYVIKIGSSSSTVIGSKSYIIKYNYNLGKDPLKDKDELYFNIIGNEWDTTINDITFKITMPESFDSSKLGFSSGKYGSVTNKVTYNVDGNIIMGKYNGTLGVGEALTVRLELPEGYFVFEESINWVVLLIHLSLIIFLIISIYILKKYHSNRNNTIPLSFYPPNNVNTLEAGYLYDGKLNNKRVISLIIYLANKGYIKIKEYSDGSFKIIKLKEYDDSNENERMLLDKLFYSNNNGSSNVLYDYELDGKLSLGTLVDDINKNIGKNKNKIFKKSFFKRFIISLMIFVTYIFMYLPLLIDANSLDQEMTRTLLNLIFSPIILIPVLICLLLICLLPKNFEASKFKPIILMILLFPCILFFPILLTVFIANLWNLIFFIIGIITMYIFMVCNSYCASERTEYGEEMLVKITGFKNFLETAQKEQLEKLNRDNPMYFYDILPFAYVLDMSDELLKKFKDIPLQIPNWYIYSDSED